MNTKSSHIVKKDSPTIRSVNNNNSAAMTRMFALRSLFVVVLVLSVISLPIVISYSHSSSTSTTKTSTTKLTTRRDMLLKTTFIGTAAAASFLLIQQPSMAEAATAAIASKADIELIQTTSDRYRLALKDKEKFIADMATEQQDITTSPLPPQIPAITFQKLSKFAHNVDGKLDDADDFPFVAIEYAEHAGAARDFAKLSRLGRIGENGSPEVALDYAKRCVLELEEASVILDTLRQAVE